MWRYLPVVNTPKVPGQGPIPRADADSKRESNPTAEPITCNKTHCASLMGGSIDRPRQASTLRPDREWIEFLQRKIFMDQTPITDVLGALMSGEQVDVLVVGTGPAGLIVAAEMAERGVSVGLIAPDTPFDNNHSVWLEEFQALWLEHCLLHKYDDALMWLNEAAPAGGIGLGRAYRQVCRRRL